MPGRAFSLPPFSRIVTAIACLLSLALRAQEPVLYHYGVEDGLPSSEVYDIIQDRRGYIWIATDRGLSRFDGYTFRNFTSQDGLPDNTVFNLHEDAHGRIWCLSSNGKLCFLRNDAVILYRWNDSLARHVKGSSMYLRSLHVDEQDNLLLGYSRNGYYSVSSRGEVKRVEMPGAKPDSTQHDVRLKNGQLMLASFYRGGARARLSYQSAVQSGNKYFQAPMRTDYLIAAARRDGSLAVGLSNRFMHIPAQGAPQEITMPGPIIRIYEDTDRSLWISCRNGVLHYAPGSIPTAGNGRLILRDKAVSCIFRDREGGLWFGTLEHGIYYQPSEGVRTFFFTPGKWQPVSGLCSGNGYVYAVTVDGQLAQFDGDSLLRMSGVRGADNSLYSMIRNVAFEPVNGRLLVITDKDIVQAEIGERQTARLLLGGGARTMLPDGKGNMYHGGMGYVHLLEPGKEQGKVFSKFNCRVDVLYCDSTHGLLAGGTEGLFAVKDSATPFLPKEPLLRSRISGIAALPGGGLALATIGRGLLLLENGKIKQFTTADGLPSNIINALAVDEKGTIWIGSNRGVSGIRTGGGRISLRTYSIANGLPTNEVRQVLCMNDYVWVGTTTGLAVFRPSRVRLNELPPPVHLHQFEVNGRRRPVSPEIELSHDENMIEFGFTGLSYKSLGNVLYRYRLEGAEESWSRTANTQVRFASLAPGAYRFIVYARNSDGRWSTSPATFSFTIRPPFWVTWWFITVCCVLALLLGWLLVSVRLRRLREKEQLKRRVVEHQQKALAAQMNPHFIFNSLNSMQAFVLSDDKENALRYIGRFSLLMRKSLENSMERYVSLRDELELLQAYLDLETMRFANRMRCELIVCEEIDQHVQIPAMLIQPYAENAIRHGLLHKSGDDGVLRIRITREGERLLCEVDDNGVGRAAARELAQKRSHRSFGASITEERLRLLCRVTGTDFHLEIIDKTDEDGKPSGTRIIFAIPYISKNGAENGHH